MLLPEVIHCEKRLATFPSPAGMSLTKLSLAGNNQIIFRQGEFGDIPAEDGKSLTIFYSVSFMPHLLQNLLSSGKCNLRA